MLKYMGIIEMKRLFSPISLNRIFRFLIVGGCSTGMDFILYMIISQKFSIIISKGISMVSSSVFSYIANKKFTFGNQEKTNIDHLLKFYFVFAANFGTNMGINHVLYHYTEDKVMAYIVATICGMTVNYLGQRLFVFYSKRH